MSESLPKIEPLQWQNVVSGQNKTLKRLVHELSTEPVVGDLKIALVRDYYEIYYRNGTLEKADRNLVIEKYLGQENRQQLYFDEALKMLADIVENKKQFRMAENLRALRDVLHREGASNLNMPMAEVLTNQKRSGVIGDVLSVGSEILDAVKSQFDSPEVRIELQAYCERLECIADEANNIRQKCSNMLGN